jgi:hypothetical protein
MSVQIPITTSGFAVEPMSNTVAGRCGRQGASSNPMLKGLSMVAFPGGGSLFWSFKDGVIFAPSIAFVSMRTM